MKYYIIMLCALICISCVSIKTDVTTTTDRIEKSDSKALAEAGIRLVMEAQEIAWNNHDLEGFMEGYWKSDSLKFYGSNGLTKGWQQTLENYKKSYPTKAESGTLEFVINDISKIEGDNYWVMGEYHLKRQIGDADGVFIILFKKINGSWKIIADMSC
ncbi:nuclear transport factor 2 family protein [Winogradskyella litoriviva]|uniref:Nuclear transport factor 2 family protein n=1 Tax=Winogradskyella litoriviva TaxID=1220182 RepID=A0ABX2DZX5_9FLAO|nr:nuclear transport factor 2 family protein [Winogradskyella litoriviva]NRD21830.1 nuclear transport factor 2 family protein [Winogradskyella litoriviva]